MPACCSLSWLSHGPFQIQEDMHTQADIGKLLVKDAVAYCGFKNDARHRQYRLQVDVYVLSTSHIPQPTVLSSDPPVMREAQTEIQCGEGCHRVK